MGEIVGAAICSHHPGLMQNLDFRLLMGAGTDSDLIGGYKRIRAEIDRVGADTVVILDSHWFTTGYHLVDGVAAYKGRYISDEMPWYLFGVPYDYQGDPELADLVEEVAKETGVKAQTMRDPDLPRHYASINLVHHMRLEDKRVMSVGTCQTAKSRHYLEMGEVLGNLEMFEGGMATSGDYERCIVVGKERYSHILNPKTGWPVKHLATVTVAANFCLIAGSASTIAMLKEKDGPAWLAELGMPHFWMDNNGKTGMME